MNSQDFIKNASLKTSGLVWGGVLMLDNCISIEFSCYNNDKSNNPVVYDYVEHFEKDYKKAYTTLKSIIKECNFNKFVFEYENGEVYKYNITQDKDFMNQLVYYYIGAKIN